MNSNLPPERICSLVLLACTSLLSSFLLTQLLSSNMIKYSKCVKQDLRADMVCQARTGSFEWKIEDQIKQKKGILKLCHTVVQLTKLKYNWRMVLMPVRKVSIKWSCWGLGSLTDLSWLLPSTADNCTLLCHLLMSNQTCLSIVWLFEHVVSICLVLWLATTAFLLLHLATVAGSNRKAIMTLLTLDRLGCWSNCWCVVGSALYRWWLYKMWVNGQKKVGLSCFHFTRQPPQLPKHCSCCVPVQINNHWTNGDCWHVQISVQIDKSQLWTQWQFRP